MVDWKTLVERANEVASEYDVKVRLLESDDEHALVAAYAEEDTETSRFLLTVFGELKGKTVLRAEDDNGEDTLIGASGLNLFRILHV